MHSFIFLWKIVLVGSFCTSRRIASSSHTPSMLRTRYLALHKNNLTIDDFEQVGFCTSASVAKFAPIKMAFNGMRAFSPE